VSKVEYITEAVADQYYTVEEAAEQLSVKPPVVRNYLYQDKLTTYKFKTLTLLSKREVEKWKDRQIS